MKDKWTIKIILLAFIISFAFSALSETIMPKVNLTISILTLIIFIIIGIIFDMIGVAITTCDIKPFHSMNAKRIKNAKIGIKLINNQAKVSSFCNDVIGDICGIISGSAGVIIAATISEKLNINLFLTSLTVTSIIAALTIGGKSLGKTIALKNNVAIIKVFSKILSIFIK
jgi:hypothetical protein